MKLRIVLAVAVSTMAVAGAANAAGPSTATVSSQITIVAATQLTGLRDLEFGTITRPTAGTTTVTLASAASATATPTVSGGNGFVPTSGQAHAAQFHLVGGAGQTYSVTASTLSFTNATGNLATVGSEAPVSAGNTLGALPASGIDDLYIGGHFDITNTTAVTAYTGTLGLTINFN